MKLIKIQFLEVPLIYSSNFPLFFKKTFYFEKHAHTQKFI